MKNRIYKAMTQWCEEHYVSKNEVIYQPDFKRMIEEAIMPLVNNRLDNLENNVSRQFVLHIENHFKEEHPDWKVRCKICNLTIDEVWALYQNSLSANGCE